MYWIFSPNKAHTDDHIFATTVLIVILQGATYLKSILCYYNAMALSLISRLTMIVLVAKFVNSGIQTVNVCFRGSTRLQNFYWQNTLDDIMLHSL